MKIASVGMTLLLGICLAVSTAACQDDDGGTATPTPTATATAIPSPPPSPPASPSPPAATPTAVPETPTAAPTPIPSPTPEAAACPDDDPAFCIFAAQVEQAIADEDADFFVANSVTQSIPCTAEEAEAGYICGPEEIGETITGIPFGWEASEGILMPLEDYRELWVQLFASNLPAESDSEGSGELRIWGLAYSTPPAAGTPRNIVVTYLSDDGQGPTRHAISLNCKLPDGQWQITSLLQHALFLGLPRDTSPEWRDWPQWRPEPPSA
ncbi:MAG: hypothetical protein JSU97_03505 [Dehalococcoidia bacterium]|nr:MAG: hypothetical protein JSU97_03505 [Dehalococcoidia bacterium]